MLLVNVRMVGLNFLGLSRIFRNGDSTQVYNNQPPIKLNRISIINAVVLDSGGLIRQLIMESLMYSQKVE